MILIALLETVLPVAPEWEMQRENLAFLSEFAVGYRYPGDSADFETARDARNRCRAFRRAARQTFKL